MASFEWCAKHNLRNPCPVCDDRALIWDLLRYFVDAWEEEWLVARDPRHRATIDRARAGR